MRPFLSVRAGEVAARAGSRSASSDRSRRLNEEVAAELDTLDDESVDNEDELNAMCNLRLHSHRRVVGCRLVHPVEPENLEAQWSP